jgi:nucleotidyltransferase substrate binding protein (TIGR01987 family)
MQNPDTRWIQRFRTFEKALHQLALFVDPAQAEELGYNLMLTKREELGLIKAFELSYEQAWLTLQDLLEERGYDGAKGPNPTLQQAFLDEYITDADGWADLHKSRKQTVHTYDQQTATDIISKIKAVYYQLFMDLHTRLLLELP